MTGPYNVSFDTLMKFNDIFPWQTPKTCQLTCIWHSMTFSSENPLKTCRLACILYLMIFSHGTHLTTSLGVYREFNDIFTWYAPTWNLMTISRDAVLKTCHLTCAWNLMTFSHDVHLNICNLTCIWNSITFSPWRAPQKNMLFDVYIEFLKYFPMTHP